MKKLYGLMAALGIFVAASYAYSANIALFSGAGSGCAEPSQMLSCLNQIITLINTQITPASMSPVAQPRNFLDNGAINIQQRGTGIVTGGTTTVPSSAHSADRWGVFTNVTSGAGRGQVTTSVPAPPTGFSASQRLYRTSGALTQPVCSIQEIPTVRATQLAGQVVTLSFQAQALAGLAADNSNVINAVILGGTGSDEGLQTLTASPAITPAWTGITTIVNQAFTITTGWVRYSLTAQIPATVTEVAVEFCFTPTATGAGTTDGFAFTGAQLEIGNAPSPFEFRSVEADLAVAQRYYWQINEPAASLGVGEGGTYATTTQCAIPIKNPVTMRIAPTVTIGGTAEAITTWAIISKSYTPAALATTYLVQDPTIANTVEVTSLSATTASTTAGFACRLVGAGGGANIQASADF